MKSNSRRTHFRFSLLASAMFLFTGFLTLSGCGGGGGGGGGGSSSTSTPPPSSTTQSSSTSQSGAMGVAVVDGLTEAAMPSASANGSGYITTLPDTGAVTGATVSSAQFQPISVPALAASASGTSLDCANSIGAAFSYNSSVVAFFSFPSNCAPSTSTLNQIGYYTTTSTNTLGFSGSSPDVGGVILDSADKWAIVSTGDGFQIISYATPSAPTLVKTISSNVVMSTGIDVNENFAFDPAFSESGVTDPMILSGGYSDNSAYTTSYDTNSFELADAKTGIIYKPDAATVSNFNAAVSAFDAAHPADVTGDDSSATSCNTDQIGIDTSYQVAVLGCEDQSFAMLLNLSAITLTAPTTSGGDGTYTLPATAIITFLTKSTASGYDLDNAVVESSTHTMFVGSGGLWTFGDEFVVGVLSNPATKFGFATAPALVTMPVTSSANTQNCTASGCSAISSGMTWNGAGDPHANVAYLNANGDAMVLWVSDNLQNNFQGMAVINLTSVLTNPSSLPAGSIWYQGIP